MKHLTLIFILSYSSCVLADSNHFTNTNVYRYSAKNGVPSFTDKKPKDTKHIIQVIQAAKPTNDIYVPVFNNQPIYTPKRRGSSSTSVNSERRNLALCKGYKRKFEAVSEKMRRGYKASEYQKLEDKRVKYRDLLFHNCDSHKLL